MSKRSPCSRIELEHSFFEMTKLGTRGKPYRRRDHKQPNFHRRFLPWVWSSIAVQDRFSQRKNRRKEMDAKNMGLAARKNFVIKRGDVVSAAVPTGGPNPYLALNWQRAAIWLRCAPGDRRFPTPQHPLTSTWENGRENGSAVTTRHVFQPAARGKTTFLLPSWLPKSNSAGLRQAATPGGAGRATSGEGPRPKTTHGILCLINARWSLHELRSD
jgi:hypothetical protein